MVPKEKAVELVSSFFKYVYYDGSVFKGAKQCALIVVDEILNEWNNESGKTAKQKYWQEVKQEIEKL